MYVPYRQDSWRGMRILVRTTTALESATAHTAYNGSDGLTVLMATFFEVPEEGPPLGSDSGLTAYREEAQWGVWSTKADLLPSVYAWAVEAEASAVAGLIREAAAG